MSFPSVLKEIPNASIHPICLETYDELAQMHGRHFSSAYAGTIEDPVTGTASGVMGAYYAEYLEKDFEHELGLIVEQGQEINKDGRNCLCNERDRKRKVTNRYCWNSGVCERV